MKKISQYNRVSKPDKSVNSKKYSRKKRFSSYTFYGINVKALVVLVSSVLLLIAFMALLETISPTHKGRIRIKEVKSTDPKTEKAVNEISSKFICSCGKCGEKSLEVCKCTRAIEERNFIREEVEQRKTSENIVVAVANQYGFLKKQFAEFYKVDKSKVWLRSE